MDSDPFVAPRLRMTPGAARLRMTPGAARLRMTPGAARLRMTPNARPHRDRRASRHARSERAVGVGASADEALPDQERNLWKARRVCPRRRRRLVRRPARRDAWPRR